MEEWNDNWHAEVLTDGTVPGQAMAYKIKEVLYSKKSKYQKITVYDTETYGKMLVLDDAVQCTERDEFSYQEMIAHLALYSHPNPKKVLVIGGGDGGVLREVCKHDVVEEVLICELDEEVVETSKKYLPNMSIGFNDSRVSIHFGDGVKYVDSCSGLYDVIIVDSSDPVGPAVALFEPPFFKSVRNALKEGGIFINQAETFWLDADLALIGKLRRNALTLYKHSEYAYTTIPSYACGVIGFLVCSTRDESPTIPSRSIDTKMSLRYYNEQVHKASFVLPKFAHKAINKSI